MLRKILLSSVTTLFLATGFTALAVAATSNTTLMQDVEYKVVPKPDVTIIKTVLEVFDYTCPHCYYLEPSLKRWVKNKADDVVFERMPVVFGNSNRTFMAKVFYTAKELGVLKQSHSAYFIALHRDKKELSLLKDTAKFFTQFNVKEKDFIATFKGFKVSQLVRKARKLTLEYGVEGVPAVIVNGQYLTNTSMAGGKKQLWKIVDELIKK